MTRQDLKEIARGFRKNIWNKEFRLRAMAVVLETVKKSDPALNDYEIYEEAGLLPEQNGKITGKAA